MATVKVIKETRKYNELGKWDLAFQYCEYCYDDGSKENGYRFIWICKRLGKERMQEGLNKLNYGNKEIGSEIDKFWLEGPLKISAMEQVKLLNLLSQSKLLLN